MGILIIPCSDGGIVYYVPGNDPPYVNWIGGQDAFWGMVKEGGYTRGITIWLLDSIPSNISILKVRVRFCVYTAGGPNHLTDIHPYGGDGQANPYADDGETAWNNCIAGTEYIDDSDVFRTLDWTPWLDLGAQACIDVQNAKSAGTRFTLGCHEEGDDDPYTQVGTGGGQGYPRAELEITFPDLEEQLIFLDTKIPGVIYSEIMTSQEILGFSAEHLITESLNLEDLLFKYFSRFFAAETIILEELISQRFFKDVPEDLNKQHQSKARKLMRNLKSY